MPSTYSSHSPSILLISETHGDLLETQFARYARGVHEAGGQMARRGVVAHWDRFLQGAE